MNESCLEGPCGNPLFRSLPNTKTSEIILSPLPNYQLFNTYSFLSSSSRGSHQSHKLSILAQHLPCSVYLAISPAALPHLSASSLPPPSASPPETPSKKLPPLPVCQKTNKRFSSGCSANLRVRSVRHGPKSPTSLPQISHAVHLPLLQHRPPLHAYKSTNLLIPWLRRRRLRRRDWNIGI